MKVAVIGGGVSGLVSAWLLSPEHEITVFEASDRIGGHTHTHRIQAEDGDWNVDTGFIVFNEKNYPGFSNILSKLGVASQPTVMSFGVYVEAEGLEYNATDINRLFAQRSNVFRPKFWRMIRDILRFYRRAKAARDAADPSTTLGDWLDAEGYSREFIDYHILPMGAALWSASPETIRSFPFRYFVDFFDHHQMLEVNDRPTWRVIKGGSSSYLEPLTRPFADGIRLSQPVKRVLRHDDRIEIETERAGVEVFDQVVLACHSDQALRMLGDPSANEREILGAMRYQRNDVLLHTDETLMPKKKRAWAAWNYRLPEDATESAAVTYDMNCLQSLDAAKTHLVSLNQNDAVRESEVLRRLEYHHPIYDMPGVSAQGRFDEISGHRRTHFCGAYWGHGFHEDGVQSALRVARAFGVQA